MRTTLLAIALVIGLAACQDRPGPDAASLAPAVQSDSQAWTPAVARQFYTQDQGSTLVPLAWLQALSLPDGRPFLHDRLARYGYLPLDPPADPRAALPIGFTLADWQGTPTVGMTCAACHTREIRVGGRAYRIDGGPAFADFETFLTDLNAAFQRLRADPAAFRRFAAQVNGSGNTPAAEARLRAKVEAWHRPFDAIISRSLPAGRTTWGVGRLDAVAMIFNRVTGLDIGTTPDRIIRENIHPADAPVRYPFIWDASRQDRTQWPGFAQNGNDLLALARNTGEVLGVFASFHPTPDRRIPIFGMNYVSGNSANLAGLRALEEMVKRIPPPAFPVPPTAASEQARQRGEAIFTDENRGNCAKCHGPRAGAFWATNPGSWETPLVAVGTDRRAFDLLDRPALPGVMRGIGIAGFGRIQDPTTAFDILKVVVVGSVAQMEFLDGIAGARSGVSLGEQGRRLAASIARNGATTVPQLVEMFAPTQRDQVRYEARVLRGIWAAAPYLHNGSVPTLEALLQPDQDRPAAFAVGPEYDLDRVGLAATQARGAFVMQTTDCKSPASGNSRCGHNYGTTLSPAEKRDLIEYLRRL